jgi:hypothetical protein
MLATYCKFKGADFCVGTTMVTVAFEPKMMNARAARTRITTLIETIAAMRLFLRPGVKLARLLAGGVVAGRLALAGFFVFGDAALVETLRAGGWIIGCGPRLPAVDGVGIAGERTAAEGDGIMYVGCSGTGGSFSSSSIS